MVFFITVLRALAACIITNSHYTGIYPTDFIANGGLIGDLMFFAISGYCLCNPNISFAKWYGKRLFRVYVPTWIITSVFLLIGSFSTSERSLFYYFVYPTDYHFVASILVLYIPFFCVVKCTYLKKRLPMVMAVVAVIMLLVYVFLYDKSYYHIDTVREPFIRFLFFESMLLGAFFKYNDNKYRNNFSLSWCIGALLALIAYFASKVFFSHTNLLPELQILNQLFIFLLLYCIFRVFSGLDEKMQRLPKWIQNCIVFIANITLEIYLVQYVLIDALRPWFSFPINWFVITFAIILSAFILYMVSDRLYRTIDWILSKIKKQ